MSQTDDKGPSSQGRPMYQKPERPRSEGGVWGSYVEYLTALEAWGQRCYDAAIHLSNEKHASEHL